MTMDWTGRRLDSIVNNGTTSSYLYDANGIRTRKTVGSTTTEYFTSGSTILAEKTGDTVLWFIYDSDGEILGFTYNGTPYYYIKNAQGDVMRIVDADGTNRATYSYDPWGKVLSASGSMAQINPIRYRSYYYDKETSLYYLQSRYYDPETGRFLNADGLFASGLTTANMFTYCNNNPVGLSDESGHFAYNKMLRMTDSGHSLLKWSNFLPSVLNQDTSAGTILVGFSSKCTQSVIAAAKAVSISAGAGIGFGIERTGNLGSIPVEISACARFDFIDIEIAKGRFDIGMQVAASGGFKCGGLGGTFDPGTTFHSFNNSAQSGNKIIHAFKGILDSCPECVITKPSANYNISTGSSYYVNGYGAHLDVSFDYQTFLTDICYIWSEN